MPALAAAAPATCIEAREEERTTSLASAGGAGAELVSTSIQRISGGMKDREGDRVKMRAKFQFRSHSSR